MVAMREQSGGEMTCEKPGLQTPPRAARERFLRSGQRDFLAGALVGKSASSAQSGASVKPSVSCELKGVHHGMIR